MKLAKDWNGFVLGKAFVFEGYFLAVIGKKEGGWLLFSLFSCRYRQKVLYLQSKYKRKLADKIWIIYQWKSLRRRWGIRTSLRLGICIVCYFLPIPFVKSGNNLVEFKKKKVEMLGVSTLFYYICSKFLKKCSNLWGCTSLTKRLKEQKSNN